MLFEFVSGLVAETINKEKCDNLLLTGEPQVLREQM